MISKTLQLKTFHLWKAITYVFYLFFCFIFFMSESSTYTSHFIVLCSVICHGCILFKAQKLILDHEQNRLYWHSYVSNVAPLKIISFKTYHWFRSVYMWKNRNHCSLLAALSKLCIFIRNGAIHKLGTLDVQSLIIGNGLKKWIWNQIGIWKCVNCQGILSEQNDLIEQ